MAVQWTFVFGQKLGQNLVLVAGPLVLGSSHSGHINVNLMFP